MQPYSTMHQNQYAGAEISLHFATQQLIQEKRENALAKAASVRFTKGCPMYIQLRRVDKESRYHSKRKTHQSISNPLKGRDAAIDLSMISQYMHQCHLLPLLTSHMV